MPLAVAAAWVLWPGRDTANTQVIPIPFTSFDEFESAPSFSPDGAQVAFNWDGGTGNNLDIYVLTVGAPTPLRLTTDPKPDRSPAWSPDGRYIAFHRRGEGIFLISPTGGDASEGRQ